MSARARRPVVARGLTLYTFVALVAACTYNGVWNARHADAAGNRALLDGDDSAIIQTSGDGTMPMPVVDAICTPPTAHDIVLDATESN